MTSTDIANADQLAAALMQLSDDCPAKGLGVLLRSLVDSLNLASRTIAASRAEVTQSHAELGRAIQLLSKKDDVLRRLLGGSEHLSVEARRRITAALSGT